MAAAALPVSDATRREGPPLRLCFVTSDYPLPVPGREVAGGGIGAHAYTLANAIAALGHDVTVLTQSDREPIDTMDGGVRVCGLPRGSRRWWKMGRWFPMPWLQRSLEVWHGLRRLHGDKPFDLIRFPDGYGEGFRFALTPLAPFSLHLHGPASVLQEWDKRAIPPIRAAAESRIERVPASRASLVVAGTRWFADYMAERWSLDRNRIRIIRNPLDIAKFHPAPTAAPQSRTILFVGHLQHFKAVECLAEAIPRVTAVYPDARFRFVGSDTRTAPGGGSMREHLQDAVRRSGAAANVEFVEPVPHRELAALYRSCLGLVLPSHREVFGNVVLEAMACGTPCIVTSSVGAAELVEDGVTGFVVAPGDPPQLARAICRLLELPQPAVRDMGVRAASVVKNSVSSQVIALETIDAYRETLARLAEGRSSPNRSESRQ